MPSLAFHSRLFALAAMLCTVIVLALVGTPDASGAPACKGAHARPGNASKRELVHATLCLLNSERAERGLRRLRLSRRLSRAARRHAMDMARRNYFSHTSLSGANFVERIRQTGYLSGATSWVVAENLAWGTGRSSSP